MTIILKLLRNFRFELIDWGHTEKTFKAIPPCCKRIIPQVEVDPRYRYTTYNTIHHYSLIICSIHFLSTLITVSESAVIIYFEQQHTLVDKQQQTKQKSIFSFFEKSATTILCHEQEGLSVGFLP